MVTGGSTKVVLFGCFLAQITSASQNSNTTSQTAPISPGAGDTLAAGGDSPGGGDSPAAGGDSPSAADEKEIADLERELQSVIAEIQSELRIQSSIAATEEERKGKSSDAKPADSNNHHQKPIYDPLTGQMCTTKEEKVKRLERQPLLHCTHRVGKLCHVTYLTQYQPATEQQCTEIYQKKCTVSFEKKVTEETVKKCYKPLIKVCNGRGEVKCRNMFETSCTTRYPRAGLGETECEKVPVELCGRGCGIQEGAEHCHQKVVASAVEVPREDCDLFPQQLCRTVTKMVPKLAPSTECSQVPREVCQLNFRSPQVVEHPLVTRWCIENKGKGN